MQDVLLTKQITITAVATIDWEIKSHRDTVFESSLQLFSFMTSVVGDA